MQNRYRACLNNNSLVKVGINGADDGVKVRVGSQTAARGDADAARRARRVAAHAQVLFNAVPAKAVQAFHHHHLMCTQERERKAHATQIEAFVRAFVNEGVPILSTQRTIKMKKMWLLLKKDFHVPQTGFASRHY